MGGLEPVRDLKRAKGRLFAPLGQQRRASASRRAFEAAARNPWRASESGLPRQRSAPPPTSRQQDEAALGFLVLDHLQPDAVRGGILGRVLSGAALIDVGDRNACTGGGLDGGGEPLDLGAVLFVRRRHLRREQMAERVHRQVQLGAFAAFGAILSRPAAALGGCFAAWGCRGWRPRAGGDRRSRAAEPAGHAPWIAPRSSLEHARRQPPHGLRVDHCPRRKVVRPQAPRRPRTDDPLQRVERLAQVVPALGGILGQEAEIGGNERPLLVADVGRARLLTDRLPARYIGSPSVPDRL